MAEQVAASRPFKSITFALHGLNTIYTKNTGERSVYKQGVEPIWLEKGLFWLETNKMAENPVKFQHR